MQNKSFLRQQYEQITGIPISDRHWNERICREYLEIDEWDFTKHRIVIAYAELRTMYPRTKIDRAMVDRYMDFLSKFPVYADGEKLQAAIQSVMIPAPSAKTIYRWGHEIGVPIYKKAEYEGASIRKWVNKILTQNRFELAFEMEVA